VCFKFPKNLFISVHTNSNFLYFSSKACNFASEINYLY